MRDTNERLHQTSTETHRFVGELHAKEYHCCNREQKDG
jgi:hypothetical protein